MSFYSLCTAAMPARPAVVPCPARTSCSYEHSRTARLVKPVRRHSTAGFGLKSSGSAEVDTAGSDAVEGAVNPLFNPQFAAVLQGALHRQGEDALFSGEAAVEEDRIGAQEEVLHAALQASRQTLRGLLAIQKEVKQAVEREQKQFERLHFALQKAKNDAAYLKTIEQLYEESHSESEQ